MFAIMLKQLRIAVSLIIVLTFLTGLLYPGLVTLIAQSIFSWHANGSFIRSNGKIIGSKWIGQPFSDPKYFWGRPSSTNPYPYNALDSRGSNLAPSNDELLALVKQRLVAIKQMNPSNIDLVPGDLVLSSASGLDPEISPLAAYYQVPRIAKARGIKEVEIQQLIASSIRERLFGMFGEPRVNVLELNSALDNLATISRS